MLRPLATTLILLAYPIASNAQWQFNGVPVSAAVRDQADPLIVTDGAGGAIIAWFDYRSGSGYDIYAQRLNAAGVPQWTADGVALCTQSGNQIALSMVSDDAGGAVVVWYDARNLVGTGLDIYAQRVNGSGTPLWTADGVVLCEAAADQSDPFVVKSGVYYVAAWHDYRNSGQADIYVQQLNSSGAVQWLADGVQLGGAAGNQFNPRLAADQVGGAIVTWEDRSAGSDIYARRITSAGAVQWSAGGVVVCNASDHQYGPEIVSDATAGAIIAWYDWRSGSPDIYMQRIDSFGASLWTANGEPICTAPGAQELPSLVQDAGGGATVVWADRRNGINSDVYAQHVNNAGVPYFAANGVAVCTAGGNQLYPRITRDPASAGIVVWFDQRSGNSDVYAQRLDYLDGSSLWTANGVVLCTQPNLQEMPSAVADGTGGAIVAWRDQRGEGGFYYDIYAEHVNGTPTPVEHMPSLAKVRVFNYPNPFSMETTLQVDLPSATDVSIGVYDVAGRRVRDYSAPLAKGWNALSIDGRDINGALLPGGVYFCRVRAGGETATTKMIIAR